MAADGMDTIAHGSILLVDLDPVTVEAPDSFGNVKAPPRRRTRNEPSCGRTVVGRSCRIHSVGIERGGGYPLSVHPATVPLTKVIMSQPYTTF
jgi:hypothetical protein